MVDIQDRNRQIEAHYRENFTPLVKLWTRRYGGNKASAEDLVQNAYLNALEYWPEEGPDNFDKWMNTIISNTGKKEGKAREEQANIEVSLDETAVDQSGPRRMLDAARTKQVEYWIKQENPKTQMVLQAYFFKQLTFEEIAKDFGYSGHQGPLELVRYFRKKYNLTEE